MNKETISITNGAIERMIPFGNGFLIETTEGAHIERNTQQHQDALGNAGQPSVAVKLSLVYPTGTDLMAAVVALKPAFPVVANGAVLPGGAPKGDPIRYDGAPGTQALHAVNPSHPYFGIPVAAIAVAKEAVAAVKSGNVSDYTLDTTPATLDPSSMRMLLLILGGDEAEAARYATIYYTRWGYQCKIPGSPVNPYATHRELMTASDRAIADAYTGDGIHPVGG
jgi:hypothetical protein